MSDLGAYKKLSEETRRFDKPLSQRVIWQLADALDSVVARLERLEAQRDEALALGREFLALSVGSDAARDEIVLIVRVLSRTEDGTDPARLSDTKETSNA